MESVLYSIAGILIPFFGTSFGSFFVFFLKEKMNEKIQKIIIGFAGGVMIAASIWSLILPAVDMAENQGKIAWMPATVGLILGVLFLIVINKIAENIEDKKDGKKLNMLIFSVTLHNIPEGMAVRSWICRIFSKKCRNRINGGNAFSNWNSNSKYTRRSNNFYAT